MSKPEEVLGMIQGLADALKSSHDNQKATQHQIEALAKTVHELASAENLQSPLPMMAKLSVYRP